MYSQEISRNLSSSGIFTYVCLFLFRQSEFHCTTAGGWKFIRAKYSYTYKNSSNLLPFQLDYTIFCFSSWKLFTKVNNLVILRRTTHFWFFNYLLDWKCCSPTATKQRKYRMFSYTFDLQINCVCVNIEAKIFYDSYE